MQKPARSKGESTCFGVLLRERTAHLLRACCCSSQQKFLKEESVKIMKSRIFSNAFFSFIALAIIFNLNISAQEVTGTITGTVRDISGAIVPGATVTITDESKNNIVVRNLTTNEEGIFSAPNLSSSLYTITVEAANFKKTIKTNVKVDVGDRLNLEIALEAGSINETVTVQADAETVNLSTPTSSTVISGEQVRELSINNRNFIQLVTLAPGVSNDLPDQAFLGAVNPAEGTTNTVNISVNGARSSQNTFTVDGADITDRGSNLTLQTYPSVDSIGEFRVLRSLYPAESGNSGGGQVNVVTRSGTNRFSGTLFAFVRNEVFNANDFLSNSTPSLATTLGRDDNGKLKRRPFRYNNFGYTIGGPVYFFNFGEGNSDEGMFRKYERTFFFFSQEFRYDRRYILQDSNVPTAELKQGIFPINICLRGTIVGTTRTCLETLPAGTPLSTVRQINPVSAQYVNFIWNKVPTPNSITAATPFRLLFPNLNKADFRQEILKIDHSFNNSVSMFYRYQNDALPSLDAIGLFPPRSTVPNISTTSTRQPGNTHTVQATYVISPKMIFEARYTRAYGAILSQNAGLLNNVTSPISISLPYPNQRDRVPSLTGTGFDALQGFGPYDNFSNKNNFGVSLTWVLGKHTLKYGGNYSRYRKNENALAGTNEGVFSGFFNTNPADATATQGSVLATGVANTGVNNSYQSWANFLLGTNATFTQAQFDYTADLRQENFEAYVQDEYRFRPNITLYVGVRYSLFGSPRDKNGRLTNFDPALFVAANAPRVTGGGNRISEGNWCNGMIINTNAQNVPVVPNCTPTRSPYGEEVMETPLKNFAPRIGVAWDPFNNGKTSVRFGYGIFHEQVLNGIYLQNIGTNQPFQQNFSVPRITINQLPAASIQTSAAAQTLRAVQTDWKTPYMQHWSLDVQRQIDGKTFVSVGYYGSKGTNLIGVVDINLLRPGQAAQSQCATGDSTTPTVACQVNGVPFTAAALILDQIRPFRGYRALNIIQPRFNSNYHSLQISGRRVFEGASQVNLSYTWAKNLTDSQNDRTTAPQNPYDIASEKSRAALDRRHIFTMNYIYELPFFTKQEGFIGKVLGGWQSSGIFTYQTGLPFTPTVANYDPAGIGFLGPSAAGGRPNVTGNPNNGGLGTAQQFFNTAGIQNTFPLTNVPHIPGNAGRGIINGPRTVRFDFTMTKNIRFGETMRLQLRAEAFNVFNTTNFRGISTAQNATAATPAFGTVLTVRDPRQLQFGAKFYF
jgi:hypothetical protein